MNFLYIVFSANVSMNDCRIILLSNVMIIDVFRLCSDTEISSRSYKKRDLNCNVDECESRLNDVSLMNENESLNDENFFEMIDKKTYR